MHDFADSAAAALDLEPLVAVADARSAPVLPAGEQLLQANLYTVRELVANAPSWRSSSPASLVTGAGLVQ